MKMQKEYFNIKKFGDGVQGAQLWSDVAQTRHEENASPKHSIWHHLGPLWGTWLKML
jgi:hypothetical protein